MSYNAIINAAPMTNMLGTQDLSTRQVPREPEAIPTHCPKIYLYAKKGPTTPQLAVGASRSLIYGEDTFDVRQKWANHATVFANGINAEGNAAMYQRVLPTDAGPEANILLSLDVLETTVDDYERNTDGSIKMNGVTGLPVIVGSPIPGFKVKWHVSHINTAAGMSAWGAATITAGDQVDGATTSQRYPVAQFKMSYVGEDGNNTGIRLWAPNATTGGGFDKRVLSREKVYPFRASVIRRNNKTGTSKVTETLFGEQSVLTTFKQGVINPITDSKMSFDEVFLDAYRNLTDLRYPPLFGEFGDVKVYGGNIQTLLDMFYAAEKDYIDNAANPSTIKHDFPTAAGVTAGDEWLFNMLTGTSTEAYPYHTFQVVSGTGSTRLGESVNIYATGSSDGTMNDTLFADLVAEKAVEYLDPNNNLMDIAMNVESILYDSGFPLDTKYALCSFISQRKDTFVALSTHEVGGMTLTASEDNSVAIALRTRLEMYPESDYFGTHVMRGLVMGRSGKIRASQYNKRVSPLYEVAVKSARYMGAGNGRWKPGKNFDGAPGSILDLIYDVSVSWTPASVRNRDWDAGLNWVQTYDRRSNFIPALKTVYNDDTSVLNSYFTAMAICEINKVCKRAWRYFSGVSNLTDGQLAERVDEFIKRYTQGRFDDRFIIEPETYYTEADTARGYSWSTRVKLYAPSLKTVMTTYVQAYRMSDYQPQG